MCRPKIPPGFASYSALLRKPNLGKVRPLYQLWNHVMDAMWLETGTKQQDIIWLSCEHVTHKSKIVNEPQFHVHLHEGLYSSGKQLNGDHLQEKMEFQIICFVLSRAKFQVISVFHIWTFPKIGVSPHHPSVIRSSIKTASSYTNGTPWPRKPPSYLPWVRNGGPLEKLTSSKQRGNSKST